MKLFARNEKYTSLAYYACAIIAVTVLLTIFGLHFPSFVKTVNKFLGTISPVFLGFAIAYLLNPIFKKCENKIFAFVDKLTYRKYTRRVCALILTYLIAAVIILVFILLIVPQITSNYQELFTKVGDYLNASVSWLDQIIANSGLFDEYDNLADIINTTEISEVIQDALARVSSSIINYSGKFVTTFTNLLIGMVISVYFLFSKEKLIASLKKMLSALFPRSFIIRLMNALRFTNRTFGQFIVGKLFDSVIIGVLTLVVLSIVRMPYAPLISAIICITNVIPFFGPFLGAIPSFIIIFIVDPTKALWFLLIILIIQQIDGNIIGPRILGNSIGISSLWIIISITVMGGLFGIPGMFLGVPIFVIVYTMIKYLTEKRLRKKNLPVDTEYYLDISYSTPAPAREDEAREEDDK